MPLVGLTRAGINFPITAFLGRAGAPVERLLASASVPAWTLNDPEALIPTAGTVRLLQAARRDGIEDVGLRAGGEARIETLGVYGRLIRRAPTLRDALEALVQNHPLFSSNGRMWLVLRGDDVELCQAFANKFGKSDTGWQQASHYILMLMIGIVRLGAGPTWRPRTAQLQTGEAPALRDADVLSAVHLSFAQPTTSIVLPRALLDEPIPRANGHLEPPDEDVEQWKGSAPVNDFVASILQVVETLSWDRYPDVHVTADAVGTSVRTLQRQLAAAGLTHESLIGRARLATAAALLEDTDTKILDIALDLGYSDHAHFTRAFRRWTGTSPQEFRRRRGEGRLDR